MRKRAVILVEDGLPGVEEIVRLLNGQRFRVTRVKDLSMVPFLLVSGGVSALLLGSTRLGQRDVMTLQKFRRTVPSMRIVVVASGPAEMKGALDSGATAFVPWPASTAVMLDALGGSVAAGEEADPSPSLEDEAPKR